ncbi:MAG TPA: hypothetical protein DGK91_02000, partial [Clostridium sp.]|nr:hypothetical protein [Clostridium sp.]
MKKFSSILITVLFILLSVTVIYYSYNNHIETKKNEEQIKAEYQQQIKEAKNIRKQKEAEL